MPEMEPQPPPGCRPANTSLLYSRASCLRESPQGAISSSKLLCQVRSERRRSTTPDRQRSHRSSPQRHRTWQLSPERHRTHQCSPVRRGTHQCSPERHKIHQIHQSAPERHRAHQSAPKAHITHQSAPERQRMSYLGSPGPPTRLCQLWPLLPLLLLFGLSPLPALIQRTSGSELTPCKIDNKDELFVHQTHYLYHQHQSLPIVIEDSDRLSHRITNRILKILLESVAGYPEVKISHCYSYDNQNITALLDRISGKTVSRHCQPPEANAGRRVPDTMINLEAWMVAGFNKAHWLDTGQLVDAGPLGPQARMGWYLPTKFVNRKWNQGENVLDHWRALQQVRITQWLSLWDDPELDQLQPGYRHRAYRSKMCRRRRNCATLFATYNGVDTGILQSQIESLELLVDIVWLGDKLSGFVERKANNSAVMFFNWHPNTLIAKGNYTRINFPETHALHQDAPVDCDFPVNQLTKVLWGPIKSGAPEAYHIISKMTFTDLEYDGLLEMASSSSFTSALPPHSVSSSLAYLRSSVASSSHQSAYLAASITRPSALNLDRIACQWVQSNPGRWGRWLPASLREKPKIYLAGLFPTSGKGWAEKGLVEAARIALEIVNRDPGTLPNYSLEMIVNDTRCKHDVAMGQFIAIQRMQPPIAGILGPGCSDAAERIASLSQHFHLLMVSYGAQASALSDRNKYPYLFRTIPPAYLYRHMYPSLFDKLGWRIIGTLTESGQRLPEFHLSLLDHLTKAHLSKGSGSSSSLVVKQKVVNLTGTPDVAQVLQEFKEQGVRVIIADVLSHIARQIMCEAFKQRMTGYEGYVWFLPAWYPQHWQDVEYYNSEPSLQEAAAAHSSPHPARESVPCTTSQVERAAQGHFVIARATLAEPDTRVAGGITVRRFQKMYAQRCANKNVEESLFASLVYDAVWVFANGLDVLLKKNKAALETFGTQANARALQAAIGNLSFSGASGWVRFQGGRSDRALDLVVQQVFSNESRLVGRFKPSGSLGSDMGEPLLQLDMAKILWLSPIGAMLDELTLDEEECFIESVRARLGVSCTVTTIIIIGLASFLLTVIAVALLFIIRCDTKMKKLKATHERMKELGLLSEEYSHLLAVDDWEIRRENIVLNRELGMGAFGAVKGGEMLKEKEGWVAVAVKTLKVQHTVEEKLDFFSEIEMMKLFKHENIVQLWGVCTRKQPMYAVMEFLLHGDLKTYLLSRRSLVGQGVKEAQDIRAENLTQMAVDIAQGLSYLHSLKYIHRDLACRNCLVHANKTVKIADFGLARHVSSTDYYRFSRKGMLPVRWTAPEALRDGIYSVKSDIWSYGVLVFEIVTFGNFPYQGLSNRQVVEEVLRGMPLKLPLQCNDALRSFIRWCMSADAGYRPDLSDILSYLAYSPAFLTPCVDAPITSVVHEDTDSMGDDSRLPHSLSMLPRPSASSLPPLAVVASAPTTTATAAASASSAPNSTSTSTSSALHHPQYSPHPIAGRAADGSCHSCGERGSLPRQKLASSGAAPGMEDGADLCGWHAGHLREKKKTFSVPGLLSSLGWAGKPSAHSETADEGTTRARSMVSASPSRCSSRSSEVLHASNICGLNACVRGKPRQNKRTRERRCHSVGPDHSNSDSCSCNDHNLILSDNKIHSSINSTDSGRDRDGDPGGSVEAQFFNRGWPESSSAPERIVCGDTDVEVHCLSMRASTGSDFHTAVTRQSERPFPSSRTSTGSSDRAEVSSSGYVSQNSKGEMKQIYQTVTSL